MLTCMFLDHMRTCLVMREACARDAGMEKQMDQRDVSPQSCLFKDVLSIRWLLRRLSSALFTRCSSANDSCAVCLFTLTSNLECMFILLDGNGPLVSICRAPTYSFPSLVLFEGLICEETSFTPGFKWFR